mgnify:CR=1 FL=1
MPRYHCDCSPRFDRTTPPAGPLPPAVYPPFALRLRDGDWYDVMDQHGERANVLSLCRHEGERLLAYLESGLYA